MRFQEFKDSDYEIHDRKHLDKYLVGLCEMIIEGQKEGDDHYGMVAAGILDNNHNFVPGLNTAAGDGKRKHAERVAMENYEEQYGEIPEGSIIITTCSPCNEDMDEREGESCTDLINHSNVRKVYCGYIDPSQNNEHNEYTLEETDNEDIRGLCEKFASTFLDESAAWHRKAGKNKNGGLNKKGVASYRREHPGSKLQTAVTTKPSKLKPGSKAAKRRKSFCARMSGVKGPMKKPNGKPTRKALSLRKWNCE